MSYRYVYFKVSGNDTAVPASMTDISYETGNVRFEAHFPLRAAGRLPASVALKVSLCD
jgi:hypothetical protein